MRDTPHCVLSECFDSHTATWLEAHYLITLEHVSKIFRSGGRDIRAVDDISFEVADGELCVLIGPSGSGKTTTMRMINRLEAASEGTIAIDGRSASPPRSR